MKFVFRQGLLEAITGDIADDMVNTIDNDNKTIDVKTTVSSINSLPNVVYHGTNTAHKDSLLAGINVYKGYKSVDFGQGFYTTSHYEQAKKLAYERAIAYNKRHKNKSPVHPMILKYKINKDKLSEYKGLIFDSPNDRWKEFIFNNRVGIDFSVSKYYNKNGKYSFVYGCVADSNITEMVGFVQRKQITYGDFVDKLKALKQYDYDQLSFHTPEVVNVLDLLEIEIIEMEAILIE